MFDVLISDNGKDYEHLVAIKDFECALDFAKDLRQTKNAKFTKIIPSKKNTLEE